MFSLTNNKENKETLDLVNVNDSSKKVLNLMETEKTAHSYKSATLDNL